MPVVSTADAKLGLLVMYAADMHTMFPATTRPPVDGRLAAEWDVLAYVTAQDAIFRAGGGVVVLGQDVCYGVVAASKADPTRCVVVIRGTSGIVEWIEDAEFKPVPHPDKASGQVEQGFFSIYQSMKVLSLDGQTSQGVAAGIAALVPGAACVTVIGHSLGSALATYLHFDLAAAGSLGPKASGLFFASPHPGDDVFAQAFQDRTQGRYTLYNYFLDAVPRVPFGPDYAHLQGVTDLRPSDANARVRFDLACDHHIVCYCAMLDYDTTMAVPKLGVDTACVACIKGAQA
jgi:hypothetical protein